ncbi:MAG: hypothetical protein Q4B65_00900 [Candidatus Saccharibacteria bacterium]|nr:hypothetical protein [Candidatus Saccharibacteria bacterium]
MDATFIQKLKTDFPEFDFREGVRFSFRFPKTIQIDPETKNGELLALHELGHALLGHKDFKTKIERLKMECAAWEKARELAMEYGVEFDDELMQDELDSYRDWLDKKMRCPKCGLTRYEDKNGECHCPRCENFA